MSRDILVTADAASVSAGSFLETAAPLFGIHLRSAADKAADGERALASIELRRAMRAAPADYWQRRAYQDRCYAAYADRLRAIDAKYAGTAAESAAA